MNATWKNRLPLVLVAALVVVAVLGWTRAVPALAERGEGPVTGPRFNVVDTEASNLIVTDNKTNMLYFYTIDKDKEIGADLKLRGTIDLNQVGKPVITPMKTKSE
jgi:hypothetical protein